MTNLAPSWRPKRLQNRGRNPKKSMLKNNTFLTSIFSSFGLRFGRVFGRFFGPKMHENCKNTFLAKTLKIVVFPRENWYFQGFQDNKYTKTVAKNLEKIDVFWNIDFEGVLGGFGDGFGRSKSLIFAFFSRKNASKKQEDFWKAKKSHFEASRANCGRSAAVCAGPGEGIKGWGKAHLARSEACFWHRL